MKLHQIKNLLLNPTLSEAKVVGIIRDMSVAFTSNRENIGDYVMDQDSVSAYSLFYLPTNIPKLKFVLDQVSDGIREDFKRASFIDFGSGPGTYSIAMLDYFNDFSGELHLVDSSTLMLDQAKKLIDGMFEFDNVYYHQVVPANLSGDVKVLFFGHSMNEIGVREAFKIIGKIKPDYVFVIEPGTKTQFEDILRLRDHLKGHDYNVFYPCYSMDECPMKERAEDWCHGVLHMVHAPDLERLSQLVSLDRKDMPLIAHLYGKKAIGRDETLSPQVEDRARLIQLIGETKFSFELGVCHLDKNGLKYHQLELLKKSMNKNEIKEFRKASRGIEICYKKIKELPGGKLRIHKKNGP